MLQSKVLSGSERCGLDHFYRIGEPYKATGKDGGNFLLNSSKTKQNKS